MKKTRRPNAGPGKPVSQETIIKRAMDFDMSKPGLRYAKDYDVDEELAKRHVLELKRYLVLCSLHPRAAYGMRGPVDDLWHTFIFYTKDYWAFCEAVNGRYIHHVPEDPDAAPSKSNYADMLAAYKIVFREDPPADIWPPVGGTADQGPAARICSNSCQGCGGGDPSCGPGCVGCDNCSAQS